MCAEIPQVSSSSSAFSSDAPAPVDHDLASVPAAELQVASDEVGSMLLLTENSGQNALVEASNEVSEPEAGESSSDDSSGSEKWVSVDSESSDWGDDDDVPLGQVPDKNARPKKHRKSSKAQKSHPIVQSQPESKLQDLLSDVSGQDELKLVATSPDFEFKAHQEFKTQTPIRFMRKPNSKPKRMLPDTSAISCFEQVFPYDLWVKMAHETNIHGAKKAAEQRVSNRKAVQWKNTDVGELQVFHGLLCSMTMTQFRALEWYWLKGTKGALRFPDYGRFMNKYTLSLPPSLSLALSLTLSCTLTHSLLSILSLYLSLSQPRSLALPISLSTEPSYTTTGRAFETRSTSRRKERTSQIPPEKPRGLIDCQTQNRSFIKLFWQFLYRILSNRCCSCILPTQISLQGHR